MKVVALVIGALLGAAAIPYMPEPETESSWPGAEAWFRVHFTFTRELWGPPYSWFAHRRPSPALRFE